MHAAQYASQQAYPFLAVPCFSRILTSVEDLCSSDAHQAPIGLLFELKRGYQGRLNAPLKGRWRTALLPGKAVRQALKRREHSCPAVTLGHELAEVEFPHGRDASSSRSICANACSRRWGVRGLALRCPWMRVRTTKSWVFWSNWGMMGAPQGRNCRAQVLSG